MGCGSSAQNEEMKREARTLMPHIQQGGHVKVRKALEGLKKSQADSHDLKHEDEVNFLVTTAIEDTNDRTGTTLSRTLLHVAVREADAAVLKELTKFKPNMNVKNSNSYTPLHVLALNGGSLDMFQVLVDAGSDLEHEDNNGNTPLHLAARNFELDIANALVKAGAKKDAKNREGNTPLEEAELIMKHKRRRSKADEEDDQRPLEQLRVTLA